jgi:hypothetical protein
MLGVCTAMTFWSNTAPSKATAARKPIAAKPLGAEGGFQLIFSQRFLS